MLSLRLAVAGTVTAGLLAAILVLPQDGVSQGPCPAPATGTSATFTYNGEVNQFWTAPEGVSELHVAVEGAHGGQSSDTYLGGPGGGVEGTIPVPASGQCLIINAGQYGYDKGGKGWSKGGSHGTSPGDAQGHSAAGGGGSTMLQSTTISYMVAGGGGGGGGDAVDQGDDGGGAGGAGGDPPQAGKKGRGGSYGGKGGCGGCGGRLGNGADGEDAPSLSRQGAGGGGGGGLFVPPGQQNFAATGGGGGGRDGSQAGNLMQQDAGGGGGGGGGFSGILPGSGATNTGFYTSTRPCRYKRRVRDGCHGQVEITWQAPGQVTPPKPVVRVLSVDLERVAARGLPVALSPVSSGPVQLELAFRNLTAAEQTLTPAGGTPVTLRLSGAVRRALARASTADLVLRATDPAGQTATQTITLR